MDAYQALLTRRTIRRFSQQPISREILSRALEAARLAPSAANKQPLSYIVVTNPDAVATVFSLTRWAGYLQGYAPPAGQRPTAFIAVSWDTALSPAADVDAGAAIENLLISAWADGVGACWIGAFDRDAAQDFLGIAPPQKIHSLVALGYPAQQPQPVPFDGDVKYFVREDGAFCVPKRAARDITRWME